MIRFLFLFAILTVVLASKSQVVDFENLPHLKPGDPVGEIKLTEFDYSIQFYIGHNIQDTLPLKFERVAHNSLSGGFYGPESDLDCNGESITTRRINQINESPFVLNKAISNRERVGCYFISGILKEEVLPSIFIFYNKPVKGCSADILDLDGHDNTIEAYDIYCYAEPSDYPQNPVNPYPIEIRALGRTFGPGVLGDNGGVMPFQIDFIKSFTLIEIRPIQQVSGGNELRTEFGFALDNYSPISVEQAPYQPPHLLGQESPSTVEHYDETRARVRLESEDIISINELVTEKNIPVQAPTIDPIYFDFDRYDLNQKAEKILDALIDSQQEYLLQKLHIEAFCDPKGTNAYNMRLAEKRAEAVRHYLISKGYPDKQVTVVARGENYSGDQSDPDWRKRVVIIQMSY